MVEMYQFKLQALLIHRRHQEEACQKDLADAQRILSAAQEHLRRLKKEKYDKVHKLHVRQKERHSRSNVLLYINYIEQLSRDLKAQREQVSLASQDVRQKRDDLLAAVKKRKTLEKLKENERLAYQQKMMQAERKFTDEAAATRHIRNS